MDAWWETNKSGKSFMAAQLRRDHSGGIQLTCGCSLLPGSHWMGSSQKQSDDQVVLQCSVILKWGLPGSRQKFGAAQLRKDHCGGPELTCGSSLLPGSLWVGHFCLF